MSRLNTDVMQVFQTVVNTLYIFLLKSIRWTRKDFLTKTQSHVSILSDTTSLFQSRRVLSRCERDDDQPIPHTISMTDGLSGLPSY